MTEVSAGSIYNSISELRPWESCRTAAERMVSEGVGRLAVVKDDDSAKVVGVVTRSDLQKPRGWLADEDLVGERFLVFRHGRPRSSQPQE